MIQSIAATNNAIDLVARRIWRRPMCRMLGMGYRRRELARWRGDVQRAKTEFLGLWRGFAKRYLVFFHHRGEICDHCYVGGLATANAVADGTMVVRHRERLGVHSIYDTRTGRRIRWKKLR